MNFKVAMSQMWNFYCGHQLNGEILTWFWQRVERARVIDYRRDKPQCKELTKSDKRRVFHHGSLCLLFLGIPSSFNGISWKGACVYNHALFPIRTSDATLSFRNTSHFAYNNNCAGSEQFPLGFSFYVTLFFNRGARNFICRVSLQIRRDWKPSLSSETERLLDFSSS